MRITGAPWVLEIVKGYKLELDCKPVPTQATSTTHHERKGHSPHAEIEKMVTKGAIVPVAPCDGQFLSQLFLLDCYAF